MEEIIAILIENGFEPYGATELAHIRIPTMRAPVFGGIGGELRTLGGRQRFKKGERRCTVGKRTTCFYRVKGRETSDFVNIPTKNVDAIMIEAAWKGHADLEAE